MRRKSYNSFWCSSFILKWQWKFRLRKPCEKLEDQFVDVPVLGLAGCHGRNIAKRWLKWQVRWVDQTQYPMIVVASLSAVPQSCRTPLQKLSVRSFTSIQMLHTHAPLPRGFFKAPTNGMKVKMKEDENEMTMKMRWRWKWDDSYLTGTQEGEHKKEKEKDWTPTPTHLARGGQTLRGQGKRKSGRTTGQKPTRGGGGAQKRLTQPTRREPEPTSAREGPKPDLERGSAHEIGDQWGPSWWKEMHPQPLQDSW